MILDYGLKPNELPLSTFAYLGDAIYEKEVRIWIIKHVLAKSGVLHKLSIQLVNAGFQAQAYDEIESTLSEEEQSILHRGRNAYPGTVAKNANIQDYKKATGFETLIGYLFLMEQQERIQEILDLVLNEDVLTLLKGTL